MSTPNGRGRGHKRKILTKRQARRIARYRAGLILESVISNGYGPDDLYEKYGAEATMEIIGGLEFIAAWLIDTGDPNGKASS